ncbi:MAG: hypothetical protein ABW252_13240 [Polyangiales bacterium]
MLARSCLVLALGLGVLAGCGDDEKDDGAPEAPTDPTGMGNPSGGDIDGGLGLDAGSTSGDGGLASDGGLTLLDGRVLGGGQGDAGCALADPQLGCGSANGGLVTFDNGIELDRATGLAWAPVPAATSMHGDEAEAYCEQLELGGIAAFELPTVDQLRTLAAGCADTVVGGSCKLAATACVDVACGLEPESCTVCEFGKGPHPGGGYCRPELANCVNSWAQTACDDNGPTETCAEHRRWYYDVAIGGFALSMSSSPIHGRCVARIAGPASAPAPSAPAPAPAPTPTL